MRIINLVTVYVFEIQSIDEQTLVKPEGAIMNGQFRETDNNGHTRQMAQTNRNTKCSWIFYSPLAIKQDITKRKTFYMWYFNLEPSHI